MAQCKKDENDGQVLMKPEGLYGDAHRLLHGEPGAVSDLPHDNAEMATLSVHTNHVYPDTNDEASGLPSTHV